MTDYYQILSVPTSADLKTIKAAYRRLALQYHPDAQTDDSSDDTMKQINEAYAVLSDPQKRAAYDRKRKKFVFTLDLFKFVSWMVSRIVR